MSAGFDSDGPLRDRLVCYRHDLTRAARGFARRLLGRRSPAYPYAIRARYSVRRAKAIVLEEKLAICNGQPSWFYTVFENRSGGDHLTNFALQHIEEHYPRSARILVTGCGTGIMSFHLAERFDEVVGLDVMPECIAVANRIKAECGYDNTSFRLDDCFNPNLEGSFDVITFMHWLYSAWGGNYGNAAQDNPKSPETRNRLLGDLLRAYAPHLNPGGVMVLELVDAVADYRIAADHPMGEASLNIYPVRFSPEQVRKCAEATGLRVMDQKLSISLLGTHQPRTTYLLTRD